MVNVSFLFNSVPLLMDERPKYQFKSVELLKDQSLGFGSYGAVCKAKCDDLLCAAKFIHPIRLYYIKLHPKESTDCPLDTLSRSVSS